jgi:hypothetical protein
VAAKPASKRSALTARARRLRDTERDAQEGRLGTADALDALQALAAEAAFALAQWKVVARLSKAAGEAPVRKVAKTALPLAEAHLLFAMDAVDRVAKREAKALAEAGD